PLLGHFCRSLNENVRMAALVKFCAERRLADGTKCAPIVMRIRSSLMTCGAVLQAPFGRRPIYSVLPSGGGTATNGHTSPAAPQHDSSADLGRDLCASDVVPRDLVDVQRADLPHDCGELAVHDLEHAIHAGLAERRKAPHVRPANADSRGAQGER